MWNKFAKLAQANMKSHSDDPKKHNRKVKLAGLAVVATIYGAIPAAMVKLDKPVNYTKF